MKNIVILISGRGSNMQAIVQAGIPGARVAAVISNRSDAAGLAWARAQGIATEALDHRQFPDREAFDTALAETVDRYQPDLVILAGYMRILSDRFVERYADRMMNIHPSLLPSFAGLHTHARVLEAGVKIAGCTVHFVTAELDHGPIVVQAVVPVLADDTPEKLAARILVQEHRIYPLAVHWFVEGRLSVCEGRVRLAGAEPVDTALLSPAG